MNAKANTIIKRASMNSKSIARSIDSFASYCNDRAASGNFKLSDPICLGDDKPGFSHSMGVYIIFYKSDEDTLSCAVVGHGNIRPRLSSFKKTLVGKSNDYNAAKKARQIDKNPLNYFVSWIIIDNKTIAAQTETLFIENYSPKFNSQASAGV
jgi:hypothetical protein